MVLETESRVPRCESVIEDSYLASPLRKRQACRISSDGAQLEAVPGLSTIGPAILHLRMCYHTNVSKLRDMELRPRKRRLQSDLGRIKLYILRLDSITLTVKLWRFITHGCAMTSPGEESTSGCRES